MKLIVVAVGHRMPAWIDAGFAEYARRMPRDARVELRAVKPATHAASPATAVRAEGERIAAASPARCLKIVLDSRGTLLETAGLARRLAAWRHSGRDVAFIIGGADGLDPGIRRSADFLWSLTPLTLPHGLVRVVLAEQLYRAASILHNHPYHRE